jgi:PAS domain S-box-containing protein
VTPSEPYKKLRFLLLEDVETDADLVKRELRKAGFNFESEVVWGRADFEARLRDFDPDLILSDFSMPQFNALDALEILTNAGRKIPFILYTGTQSEEVAVECMKRGADDYLLKSSLTRLPKAVDNVLSKSASAQRERQAAEALRVSEQNFRSLIEGSPDALLVVIGGRIVYANPALISYLGYESAEAVAGLPFGDVIYAEDRADGIMRLERARINVPVRMEERFVRSDGSVAFGEGVAIAIEFRGSPAKAVIVRDLTERKQMQSRLLLADRLASVGTLAAGVAHEINNPLGYMITNLQVVDEELGDITARVAAALRDPAADARAELGAVEKGIADLEEPIRIARRGADRVRHIVRDLMTFSRADTENKSSVDVRDVLEFTLKMAANELKRKAEVVKEFEPVPPVLANESRLGQVFLNLVINAAQALPEGGPGVHRITVATRAAEGRVLIEVADTGAGIPWDIQQRIFDPFFTTKPVGVGTGLGLSICHSLVTALGGTIAVESEVGRGAKFTVSLPAA